MWFCSSLVVPCECWVSLLSIVLAGVKQRCSKLTQAFASSEETRRQLILEFSGLKTSYEVARKQFALDLSKMKGSYEELWNRHTANKKDREQENVNGDKMNNSLLHLDTKVKVKGKQLLELESELVASRNELVHLSPQLAVARAIRDRAFGYGYGVGMAQLQSHLLVHPWTELWWLDLKTFNLMRFRASSWMLWGAMLCPMLSYPRLHHRSLGWLHLPKELCYILTLFFLWGIQTMYSSMW